MTRRQQSHGIVDFKRQPRKAIKLCKKRNRDFFSLHETFVIKCDKMFLKYYTFLK